MQLNQINDISAIVKKSDQGAKHLVGRLGAAFKMGEDNSNSISDVIESSEQEEEK
jgi:hypothetical protein